MAVTGPFIRRITRTWLSEAPNFWWGDRLDGRFVATDLASRLRGQRVLDIGCNAGVVLAQLDAGNACVGLEFAEEPLRIAARLNPDRALVRGDMLRLPFGDGSFDAALFFGMLEVAAPDRQADAIAEVVRVLRPGGRLLMTALNRGYRRYRNLPSRPTYDEVQTLLAPWFDVRIRGFNPVPPFPYGPPNAVLARMPGIWPALNWMMERDVAVRHCCSFVVTAVKRAGRPAATGAAHG